MIDNREGKNKKLRLNLMLPSGTLTYIKIIRVSFAEEKTVNYT